MPKWHSLAEVPPSAEYISDPQGEALGLPLGVRAEKARQHYRCACCHSMMPKDSWMAMMPDQVSKHDPLWSVIESARLNAYNGTFSGWCIKCATGFSDEPVPPAATTAGKPNQRKSTYRKFIEWLGA